MTCLFTFYLSVWRFGMHNEYTKYCACTKMYIPTWQRITDEGSLPEMRIWSIVLIKVDFKWCVHLKPRSNALIYTRGEYYTYKLCIICTRVYFWACERNCIYVKVNLHMCKYTPPCNIYTCSDQVYICILYVYVFLVM